MDKQLELSVRETARMYWTDPNPQTWAAFQAAARAAADEVGEHPK